jgi:two-component system response regulator FixJ
MMADRPTVFVIDDEAQVRRALMVLIASAGLRVESYATAQEFLDAFDDTRPGCILADLRMPGMSGLQLQYRLANRGCTLPLIVLSAHGDIPTAVQAMKAGAMDFIEKPYRDQPLLDCIHAALRRNATLRRQRAEQTAARARLASLTAREREVLSLLVTGQPNKVIAARLKISPNTVENHRAKIMKKTKAGNLPEVVRLALLAGLDEEGAVPDPDWPE